MHTVIGKHSKTHYLSLQSTNLLLLLLQIEKVGSPKCHSDIQWILSKYLVYHSNSKKCDNWTDSVQNLCWFSAIFCFLEPYFPLLSWGKFLSWSETDRKSVQSSQNLTKQLGISTQRILCIIKFSAGTVFFSLFFSQS